MSFYVQFVVLQLTSVFMMDAKRITNFSQKTTQPLIQNSSHAPANLQNRYLFDHDPLKLADTYRTDELSYVLATLKQQLTDRYAVEPISHVRETGHKWYDLKERDFQRDRKVRWEDNIIMDLKEVDCNTRNQMYLRGDRN